MQQASSVQKRVVCGPSLENSGSTSSRLRTLTASSSRRVVALVVAQRVEMLQSALFGRAKVVDDGSGGDRGGMVMRQPHAVQRVHAQLLAKQGKGIVLGEGPLFDLGARAGDVEGRGLFGSFGRGIPQHALANALRGATKPGAAASVQHFRRPHARQLVQRQRPGVAAGELGGAELAGGEVERGNAYRGGRAGAVRRDAGEPLALAGVERRIDRRAGREDARHLAADDGLRGLGVLHLLAQRHAVALAQQALQVGAGGVVGDAAHGHGLGLVARGEGELQLPGGDHRVLVEELVEVAEAEEQQSVGVRILGGAILPHDRGEVALAGCSDSFRGQVHAFKSECPEYRTRLAKSSTAPRLAE